MSEFVKVFNMQGFDVHHTPRWQMVPNGGVRYIALRDGAGLTVASSDTSVLTVKEIKAKDLPTTGERMTLHSTDRILELTGVSKGSAKITATGGGKKVTLEVDTKDKKTMKLAFNFVSDSGGHKTTRVPASAAQWTKEINYIYNGQANIFVTNKTAKAVSVTKNLGTTIETTKNGVGEEADLYPLGDTGADVNYFFVWDMDITDDPADEDAFTDGKNIVFEDTAGSQFSETLSHELGHAMGLPDNYTIKRQLMYGYTDVRGVDLPKDHVNIINP